MSLVLIRKSSYRYETLKPLVFSLLDRLGGERMSPGSRVLIKPNLMTAATVQQAIVTHPAIVRSAVEYTLDRGARPLVADSPALGSFPKILRESGLEEALAPFAVACRPFQDSLKIDIGQPFGMIEIAREAIESDFIINLPKLKTHSQMLLTLGVKNLFGCVVGYRKPEWHMKTGVDRALFARLLVQLYQRISPAFTVLDGIVALEGEGPGKRGNPREIGLLFASDSAVALDLTVCRLLNLDPDELPVLRASREAGLLEEAPAVDGPLESLPALRLPGSAGSLLYGPAILQRTIRLHFLPRPAVEESRCRHCGACSEICPVKAIGAPDRTLVFDYDRCIRCCCCIEICPHGALHTVDPLPGRILRKIVTSLS